VTRNAKAVAIGGSFEKEKTVDGLEALLSVLRTLRSGPPDADALARSKIRALAGWRQSMATNAGVAAAVSEQVIFAQSPAPDDVAARIASVSAADVQRVARAFLADEQLRVVVVGDVRWITSDLQRLGLGSAVLRDGFGRD
jgi:zinc protease